MESQVYCQPRSRSRTIPTPRAREHRRGNPGIDSGTTPTRPDAEMPAKVWSPVLRAIAHLIPPCTPRLWCVATTAAHLLARATFRAPLPENSGRVDFTNSNCRFDQPELRSCTSTEPFQAYPPISTKLFSSRLSRNFWLVNSSAL